MAEQVRVVLGMFPPLLGGIVRQLLTAAPGIEVVGEAVDAPALAEAVHRLHPSAVVVELEGDALPPACCSLLCEAAGLVVIGIARPPSRATLFVLQRSVIHDLGPRDLVTAVLASSPPRAR